MASIGPKRPDGTCRARYRDGAGKEHARHFARKIDAQRWLDEQTSALVRGDYTDPKASSVHVSVVVDAWLRGQVHLKATGRTRVEGIARNYVLPRWGTVKLRDVAHSDVQAWVAELVAAGLSPSSVQRTHGVLSQVFDVAVRDRRLASNPCKGDQPAAQDQQG